MEMKDIGRAYYDWYQQQLMSRSGCGSTLIVVCLLAMFLFCSCSTQYIPVETIKTVYQNNTDTVIQHDSVKTEINTILREARPEDSAMIANLGIRLKNNERLLILLQNQLKESSKDTYEHAVDTFIKTDSIQVPYPVERKLSKWESFCLDYGKLMLGASTLLVIAMAIIIVRWITKRRNG